MAKNPNWTSEEVILLVYTYFNVRRSGFSSELMKQHASWLSKVLNELPIHPVDSRTGTFRNTNGIMIKLQNFVHLDDDGGSGLSHYSRLDKEIFEEYKNNEEMLCAEVERILRKYNVADSSK